MSAPVQARWTRFGPDTATMTGRALRLAGRDPDELLVALIMPTLIMLMFVYVFGGAMEVGTDYLTYATPGVILLCAGFGASNTAIAVTQDMADGIMDRFRSMPVASATVLAGHVLASVARNLVTTAIVLGVATLIGFRADAGIAAGLGAVGVVTAYILAITCVSVFVGVVVRTPAAAGGFGFVMLFLPYVSSAFVPPETMPGWLRGFAEVQPVTPVIESVRGLLVGMGSDGAPAVGLGSTVAVALAWCAGAAVLFLAAASWAFARRSR
ncbi:multidrug efflux ABC transporter permease LieB [Pseudonocardia kongjuensis]|uniref:Transport permease protein n=1 Tax=Pseudonocardia kongjuensis TaxID=102227 RepID=A0ABN1XNR6_9PSEU